MKDVFSSLRAFLFLTIVLGVVYPVLTTLAGQTLFPNQASGELLKRGGTVIGARLIGQKFESERYFWSRPSAVDYNPLPSGGSNLGPTSADLQKAVDVRRKKLGGDQAPSDLIFASASGLDPHISPGAAAFQISRVAKARGLSEDQVQQIVSKQTELRQLGVLGEPVVNVLTLNEELDSFQGITAAPSPVSSPNGS